MMSEDASSFHTSLLPITLIDISIGPHHFALLVIAAILKLTFIGKITRDCQFSLAVLAVTFPSALIS